MKNVKLKYCILMDAIGMISYTLPFWGETIDAIWAPIAGFIFYKWFRRPMIAILAGIEEIIPFTDIIPTFTIAYFLFKKGKK